MKLVIGGILGGLAVIAVLFLLPEPIEESIEIIERQLMHPCQKLSLDNHELYSEFYELLDIQRSALKNNEYYEKKGEEFDKREEQILQLYKDYDCDNIKEEWQTPEFIKKITEIPLR